MKFIRNSIQGKRSSLEEGPEKGRSINEYLVLRQDESTIDCTKFVQTVKVILCIELIIFIGWLGCVSFSYYNANGNADREISSNGYDSSRSDDIEVGNVRASRSVGDTGDSESCERITMEIRTRVNSLAARIVIGESSDPTVVQLRRIFTIFVVRNYFRVLIGKSLGKAIGAALGVAFALMSFGIADSKPITSNATDDIPFGTMSDDVWRAMVVEVIAEFVNSTDPENRQRLQTRAPSAEEMMREFRTIAPSFRGINSCNATSMSTLLSVVEVSQSDLTALIFWDAGPALNQLTLIGCNEAEAQLLKDRRGRLEAIGVEMASDYRPRASTIVLLNSIASALKAKNSSDVTVEDDLLQYDGGLIPWKRYVSKASLQLKKEFYELVRDKFLELRNESNESSSWTDYDLDKAWRNATDGLSILTASEDPVAVLNYTIQFGNAFNLHYVNAEGQEKDYDSFGIFTYLDEEPEKLGVRRLRHILNGFVRLFFRVRFQLGPCQPWEFATEGF